MLNDSINKIIVLPKHFNETSIISFINKCQRIFDLKGKNEEGFALDVMKVEKSSMLGVLVLYKVIEYTITKKCFKSPKINLIPKSPIGISVEKYGFKELLSAYLNDNGKTLAAYKKLKISTGDNFIIAPQALLRDDKKSKEDINKIYLPKIEEYYSYDDKTVTMIFQTFSEILLNFWEHATGDTNSIIVASGNKDRIEIACADTGRGIISSITEAKKYQHLTGKPEKALKKALEKGITSKENTNHMGYGLWILDQMTNLTKGRLHIYSQGVYYHNEYGRPSTGKCGNWQGSIFYLSLPLNNPKTLEDIEGIVKMKDLNINWG